MRLTQSTPLKCSKDIFVPLTICIDEIGRALVIVLPCYGALEIVGVIIIIIIIIIIITQRIQWESKIAKYCFPKKH